MVNNNTMDIVDFYQLKKELDDLVTDYWSCDRIFSYGAFFNFVIGGRGIGKTFTIFKWLINRFLKKGTQFMYLRRRKTELDRIEKDKFFPNDLLEQVFKNFEIVEKETTRVGTRIFFNADNLEKDVNKLEFLSSKVILNGEVICYLKNLSTWVDLKGSSYENVDYIFFDEVLIDETSKFSYLNKEVDTLLNVVSTVFRRRPNCKIILASNACNYNNPYFNFFHFEGDTDVQFHHLKSKKVIIEFPKNTSYDVDSDMTKLSIDSKSFSSSALNQFQRKNNGNIEKFEGTKYPLYCIYHEGKIITIYQDKANRLHVKTGIIVDQPLVSFNINDVENGIRFLRRSEPIPSFIRKNYYNNNVFYDSLDTKVSFQEAVQSII